MIDWVLNAYLIILLILLSYMVCYILFWNSTWSQDHNLFIKSIILLSLSFILHSLVDIIIETVKIKSILATFSQCVILRVC